jgi:hypothetical protein
MKRLQLLLSGAGPAAPQFISRLMADGWTVDVIATESAFSPTAATG